MVVNTGRETFLKLFNVSRETLIKLDQYEKLLIKYNCKLNLIGGSTVDNIWKRHFSDSAKIFTLLENFHKNSGKVLSSLCDLGTGAGLPGIILAILNEDKRLNINFTLVDSNAKKYAFLKEVLQRLNLRLFLKNKRAEEIASKFDFITARAVARLDKLLHLSKSISKRNTIFIFHKGKNWSLELEEIKKKWHYTANIVKNNQLIDKSGGVTLILTNVSQK